MSAWMSVVQKVQMLETVPREHRGTRAFRGYLLGAEE